MKKFIVMVCVLGATMSFAQGPCRGGDSDCTPPQEAIDACEGQSTDATCQVTSPQGDLISGTCKNTPDKKYFVCMPERKSRGNKEERN